MSSTGTAVQFYVLKSLQTYPFGKEEIELSLFANDMSMWKIPRNLQKKKCLELTSEFSKVIGYTINTQKSIAFYRPTMNIQILKLKTLSFTPAQKKMKYLIKHV